MDPGFIAAVAASLAAIFSGLTLWVSALRDERKWRRDSLVETLADFLDASFGRPGNIAYRARLQGIDMAPTLKLADEAHARQIRSLTRLRLLGSGDLVRRAIALYDIENQISKIVLIDRDLPDIPDWELLYERRRLARSAFLTAARLDLQVGRTRQIESGLHRPLPFPTGPDPS